MEGRLVNELTLADNRIYHFELSVMKKKKDLQILPLLEINIRRFSTKCTHFAFHLAFSITFNQC